MSKDTKGTSINYVTFGEEGLEPSVIRVEANSGLGGGCAGSCVELGGQGQMSHDTFQKISNYVIIN